MILELAISFLISQTGPSDPEETPLNLIFSNPLPAETPSEEGVRSEFYSERPDILSIKPHLSTSLPATTGNPSDWPQLRLAHLEVIAELIEMYPDHELYFLARDAEYIFDLARVLMPDSSRIHLINVSRANMESENLVGYLAQNGISSGSIAEGKKILFVDTGFAGTIPATIASNYPANFPLFTHLLVSNNFAHPSSRAFLWHLNSSVSQINPSNLHSSILPYEHMPRFTWRANEIELLPGGQYEAVATTGEQDGKRSRAEAMIYMSDLAAWGRLPEIQKLFSNRREIWKKFRAAANEGRDAVVNAAKNFLDDPTIELPRPQREAFVQDYFEILNRNEGAKWHALPLNVTEVGIINPTIDKEKKGKSGGTSKAKLIKQFPQYAKILKDPVAQIPKMLGELSAAEILAFMDLDLDSEIRKIFADQSLSIQNKELLKMIFVAASKSAKWMDAFFESIHLHPEKTEAVRNEAAQLLRQYIDFLIKQNRIPFEWKDGKLRERSIEGGKPCFEYYLKNFDRICEDEGDDWFGLAPDDWDSFSDDSGSYFLGPAKTAGLVMEAYRFGFLSQTTMRNILILIDRAPQSTASDELVSWMTQFLNRLNQEFSPDTYELKFSYALKILNRYGVKNNSRVIGEDDQRRILSTVDERPSDGRLLPITELLLSLPDQHPFLNPALALNRNDESMFEKLDLGVKFDRELSAADILKSDRSYYREYRFHIFRALIRLDRSFTLDREKRSFAFNILKVLTKLPIELRAEFEEFERIMKEIKAAGTSGAKTESILIRFDQVLEAYREKWSEVLRNTREFYASTLPRSSPFHIPSTLKGAAGNSTIAKPSDYKIVEENFKPSGKHGRISLVKRNSDGKLFVWKQAKDDSPEHLDSFRSEIDRAKKWKELGLSDIDVFWHPDAKSLLKTYVHGKTLYEIMETPDFWTTEDHPARIALKDFLKRAALTKHYVGDLHPRNLVFDGKILKIIDSGSIRERSGIAITLEEYGQKLRDKFSKRFPQRLPDITTIFEKITCSDLVAKVGQKRIEEEH